jgi:hypothetical protein
MTLSQTRKIIIVLFAVAASLFPGKTLLAYSIGISPSKIIITVEKDTVVESQFTFSRSDGAEADLYEVSLRGKGARFIDIGQRKAVSLQKGEMSVPYHFFINTTGAPLGNYEAVIDFIKSLGEEVKGLKAQAGISGKVSITVVEELPSEPLDFKLDPFARGNVSLRNFRLSAETFHLGDTLSLDADVQNNSQEAIKNIFYSLTLAARNSENSFYSNKGIVAPEVLLPQGIASLHITVPLTKIALGDYEAVLKVGYNQEKRAFTISAPFPILKILLGLGGAIIFLLLLAATKQRSSRRIKKQL